MIISALALLLVSAQERNDVYGDPLPMGALVRIGTPRLRHDGVAKSVTFTPDGLSLVSMADDLTIRFWDPQTGAETRRLQGRDHGFKGLAFFRDGKRFATIGSSNRETVRVWDTATLRTVLELEGIPPALRLRDVAVSPDGKTLAVATDKGCRLYDAETGKVSLDSADVRGGYDRIVFAPDGKGFLACNITHTFHLLDSKDGRVLATFDAHAASVRSMAFSPDGSRVLSGGVDRRLYWCDVPKDRERMDFDAGAPVRSVAVSPDGRTIAAAAERQPVRMWDAASGKEVRSLPVSGWGAESIAFSPDGKLLAAAGGGMRLRLWDTATGEDAVRVHGHSGSIGGMAVSPDGKTLFTGGFDGTLGKWDLTTGKAYDLVRAAEQVSSVALSPDGKTLATGIGIRPIVQLWDPAKMSETGRLEWKEENGCVISIAFSPDGRSLAAGCGGHHVRVWDVAGRRETAKFRVDDEYVSAVAFTPDGKTLAVGVRKEVSLRDPATGLERRALKGHSSTVYSLAFTPDGRTLHSGAADRSVRTWDLAAGAEPLETDSRGTSGSRFPMALSPDARLLAWGGNDRIILWEAASRKELMEIGCPGPDHLAFCPDGRRLVSSHGATALVWSLRPAGVEEEPREPAKLWERLAGDAPLVAWKAAWALEAAGGAAEFLSDAFAPLCIDAERAAKRVAALEADDPAAREQAARELRALGNEALLRNALEGNPSAEARARITEVLKALEGSPEPLRRSRAIAVLERLGTPAARALLASIAGAPHSGASGAEARAVLGRVQSSR